MSDNIIGTALDEIYRWFTILNEKYFNNELPRPMITIQKGRKNNLGYITLDKVWTGIDEETGNDKEALYEINITAENLNRPVAEIVGTLQHEMVHYIDIVHGIKDCSGQVHNKKFRSMAESKGLICEKVKSYGWGITSPNDELNQFINEVIKPNEDVFSYFRLAPLHEKERPKKSIFKYTCPVCGLTVKAKKKKNIMCGECSIRLEMEDDEDGDDEDVETIPPNTNEKEKENI